MDYWNSHTIRRNRNFDSPSGRPCDMYDMPSIYGMVTLIPKILTEPSTKLEADPRLTISREGDACKFAEILFNAQQQLYIRIAHKNPHNLGASCCTSSH